MAREQIRPAYESGRVAAYYEVPSGEFLAAMERCAEEFEAAGNPISIVVINGGLVRAWPDGSPESTFIISVLRGDHDGSRTAAEILERLK